jgi:hypothetical protein
MKLFVVVALALAAVAAGQEFNEAEAHATTFWGIVGRLEKLEVELAKYEGYPAVSTYDAQLSDLETELTDMISESNTRVVERVAARFETTMDTVISSMTSTTQAIHANIDDRVANLDDSIAKASVLIQDTVDSKLATSQKEVDTSIAEMQKILDDSLASIDKDLLEDQADLDKDIAAMNQKASASLKTVTDAIKSKVDPLPAVVDKRVKGVQDQVASVGYPPVLGWSGGCNHHGQRNGWYPYCHSNTEWMTANDFLEVTNGHENSDFKAKKDGFFRIVYFGIGQRAYNHVGLWHNDRHVHHGNDYTDGNWRDEHMDITWRFKAGDTFWVQIYGDNHGTYQYHAWNNGGTHSRLQVFYAGPLE